jgi:protein TonB
MLVRLSSGQLLAFGVSAALHVIGVLVVQAAGPYPAPGVGEPLVAELIVSEPPRIEPPRAIKPSPPRIEPPRPKADARRSVEPPAPVEPARRVEPPRPGEPPRPAVEPPAPRVEPVAPARVEPTPPPAMAAPAPVETPVAPQVSAPPAGPPVNVPRSEALPPTDASPATGINMAPGPRPGPPSPAPRSSAPGEVAALPPSTGPQSLHEAVGSGRLGVVHRPGPRYPESARRAGVQGTTLLKVHVLDNGRPVDITVEESAGHAALDQAALEAVRRWRFEPARENGKPVALWVLIPFEFRLR